MNPDNFRFTKEIISSSPFIEFEEEEYLMKIISTYYLKNEIELNIVIFNKVLSPN